jgi:hypothetical protein
MLLHEVYKKLEELPYPIRHFDANHGYIYLILEVPLYQQEKTIIFLLEELFKDTEVHLHQSSMRQQMHDIMGGEDYIGMSFHLYRGPLNHGLRFEE